MLCQLQLLRWPWKLPVSPAKVPEHHSTGSTGEPATWPKRLYSLKKYFLFSQMQDSNHRRTKAVFENGLCFARMLSNDKLKWVNPSEIQLLPRKRRLQWVADIRGWQKWVLKKWHEVSCCNKKSPLLAMLCRVPGIRHRYSSASMHI